MDKLLGASKVVADSTTEDLKDRVFRELNLYDVPEHDESIVAGDYVCLYKAKQLLSKRLSHAEYIDVLQVDRIDENASYVMHSVFSNMTVTVQDLRYMDNEYFYGYHKAFPGIVKMLTEWPATDLL